MTRPVSRAACSSRRSTGSATPATITQPCGVDGQEISQTTSSIARVSLLLYEIEDFDIKRGALRVPAFNTNDGAMRQFDAMIDNSPFSVSDSSADRWPADPRAFGGVPPARTVTTPSGRAAEHH